MDASLFICGNNANDQQSSLNNAWSWWRWNDWRKVKEREGADLKVYLSQVLAWSRTTRWNLPFISCWVFTWPPSVSISCLPLAADHLALLPILSPESRTVQAQREHTLIWLHSGGLCRGTNLHNTRGGKERNSTPSYLFSACEDGIYFIDGGPVAGPFFHHSKSMMSII